MSNELPRAFTPCALCTTQTICAGMGCATPTPAARDVLTLDDGTPVKVQRSADKWYRLLAYVLHCTGEDDLTFSEEEMLAMPKDVSIVVQNLPGGAMRLRLMSTQQAQELLDR